MIVATLKPGLEYFRLTSIKIVNSRGLGQATKYL
jgi:hypothetical protein